MGISVLAVMVVLGVLLWLGVRAYDLKRQREEEAVAAQARVSDALLMDATMAGLPLTPTAHVPLWKGSPLVLTITGAVPRGELRVAAIELAKRELARGRPDFLVDDQISVDPGVLNHAA